MSASSVDDLATGPGNALLAEAVVVEWEAVAEVVLPRIEVFLSNKKFWSTSVFVSIKTGLISKILLFLPKIGFQFVSSSLPDICYRCGESGHLAKDCDLQEDGKCLTLPFIPF